MKAATSPAFRNGVRAGRAFRRSHEQTGGRFLPDIMCPYVGQTLRDEWFAGRDSVLKRFDAERAARAVQS